MKGKIIIPVPLREYRRVPDRDDADLGSDFAEASPGPPKLLDHGCRSAHPLEEQERMLLRLRAAMRAETAPPELLEVIRGRLRDLRAGAGSE
jgi:hypothetical protein